MPPDESASPHLAAGDVAAYLDRALAPADRARVEAHLAECDVCRGEAVEVRQLRRSFSRRRRRYLLVPLAAAAAALVVLLAWPRMIEEPSPPAVHRGPAGAVVLAPLPVAPIGQVGAADTLRWSVVPRADRYRLTLFDSEGSVVWEGQTADSAIALPNSVRFKPRASYYWKVEARTGWNRWAASGLVEFRIVGPGPPK